MNFANTILETHFFTKTQTQIVTPKTTTPIMQRNLTRSLLAIALFCIGMFANEKSWGQNVSATWGSNSSTAWYTVGNWAGGSFAGIKSVATSNANIATFTSAFTGTTPGINMTTSSLSLGAISIDNTRTTALNVGNSGGTAGTLAFYGASVNSVSNTIIRNNGTGLLTLQASQSGTMGVVLSNSTDNIINTDGSGGITISSVISGSNPLTKTGSSTTAILTLTGVNTYTGATKITAGELRLNPSANVTATTGQLNMNGGTLGTTGITATRSVTYGTLNLTANSKFDLATGAAHTLNFSASNGISWTGSTMLTIYGWQGSYNGTTGNKGQIFVGTTTGGLTSGQLLQIQFNNGTIASPGTNYPATIITGGEVVAAAICAAPTIQTAIGTVSSTAGGMTIPVSGGNGDSRLIKFNTSAPSLSPVDGTTYNAATSYATAGTEQTVLAGSGTTVTVSNLVANTLYYYKAWEYNACSSSPKYNTTSAPSGSFTTLQNAPTVGSGSGATSSAFTAAWTAPSGGGAETYTYSIDVDDNSSFTSIDFSQTGIASGTTTANVNSGLSANTPYYFRVKAVNAGGSSAWSSTSSAYSTLPGNPTVTTPTAANITSTSADLGANITSNGGGTITDYGTVYKTSTGVTITDNFLSAGTSNITGTFSHTRSLSAETHYYYKGYATNAANTVLTSEGNFYTLSTAPSAAAGSFSSAAISYSQIDLTFAAASTITNADGYIILQRVNGAAPTGVPSNANSYSVGNTIGNGTVAAIVNSTSATTQSITGLSSNTNYYFVIIPYNADATPTSATYQLLQY